MSAQRRRVWDEKDLARILAAHRYGLSTAEIATRFECTATTIQKRLSHAAAARSNDLHRDGLEFLTEPRIVSPAALATERGWSAVRWRKRSGLLYQRYRDFYGKDHHAPRSQPRAN